MTTSQGAARPAVMVDVARLAGVSHQTVSRVLNDHPSVRPATRERVLRAVSELGYRPNGLARGLVRRRSHVLGVVSFDPILFGPASTLLGIVFFTLISVLEAVVLRGRSAPDAA